MDKVHSSGCSHIQIGNFGFKQANHFGNVFDNAIWVSVKYIVWEMVSILIIILWDKNRLFENFISCTGVFRISARGAYSENRFLAFVFSMQVKSTGRLFGRIS